MKMLAIIALASLLAGCASFNFQKFGIAICGSDCEFVNKPASAASAAK